MSCAINLARDAVPAGKIRQRGGRKCRGAEARQAGGEAAAAGVNLSESPFMQ